jgi:AbrB family looped-hinge helix DNA binding protein
MATVEQRVKPQLQAKTVLAANGRIVIPAAIRAELGFKPGETLVMEVHEGKLRVESFDARLAQIQDELLQIFGPERSLSDELIAERRAEALHEQEESDHEREAMLERVRKAS